MVEIVQSKIFLSQLISNASFKASKYVVVCVKIKIDKYATFVQDEFCFSLFKVFISLEKSILKYFLNFFAKVSLFASNLNKNKE